MSSRLDGREPTRRAEDMAEDIENDISNTIYGRKRSRLTRASASGGLRSARRAPEAKPRATEEASKTEASNPLDTPPQEWRGLPSRRIQRKRSKTPDPNSPMGLTIYFGKALEGVGVWQTNVKALCKFFSDCTKSGIEPSQLRAMVDRFAFDRQRRPGNKPAWQEFLWRRDELIKKTQPSKTQKNDWSSITEKYTGVSE